MKIKTSLHQARQQPLGDTATWGQQGGAKGRAQVLAFHLESGRWGEANAQTQLGGDRDSAQCQGRDIGAFPAAARALSPAASGMLEASRAWPGSALLTHALQVCTDMDTATCTTPCGSRSRWRPTPLSGSPPSHGIPGEQPHCGAGRTHSRVHTEPEAPCITEPWWSGRKSLPLTLLPKQHILQNQKSCWRVLEAIWSVKSSRLLTGETKVEPGHGDLWKERWLWSWEGGGCSMWWAVRGPGWIQIP